MIEQIACVVERTHTSYQTTNHPVGAWRHMLKWEI